MLDFKIKFENICDENTPELSTVAYSRILSTSSKCAKTPLIEDKLFLDGDEMNYEIPLFSANIFPSIAKEAYVVLEAMKRSSNDFNANKILFTEFRDWLKKDLTQKAIKKHWEDAFKVLPIKETVDLCADFPSKPCEAQNLKSILPGAVFTYQTNYVSKLHQKLTDAKQLLNTLNNDKVFKEEVSWECELKIGVTLGSSGLGFCTPDTNIIQFTVPTIAWSGTINSEDGDNTIQTEYGGEFVFVPPTPNFLTFAIQLGAQRQISARATKTAQVGFKFYLPSLAISAGDGAVNHNLDSLSDSGRVEMMVAAQIVPMVVKFIDMGMTMYKDTNKEATTSTASSSSIKSWPKRLKEYFTKMSNKFSKRAFWEFLGIAAKNEVWKAASESIAGSLMEQLSGSSYNRHVMIDINIGFHYSSDEQLEDPTKYKIKVQGLEFFCEVSASFFNIADVHIGIDGFPALKPSYGEGIVIDLGLLITRAYVLTRTPSMTASEKETATEMKKEESTWVDTRTVLCRECTRQVERLHSSSIDCDNINTLMAIAANKDDDADAMTHDEAKTLCNAVFYDMTSFLAADKTSIFFSKSKQRNKAKENFNKEFATFNSFQNQGSLGPKCEEVKSPYCDEQKFCEYAGIGCYGFFEKLSDADAAGIIGTSNAVISGTEESGNDFGLGDQKMKDLKNNVKDETDATETSTEGTSLSSDSETTVVETKEPTNDLETTQKELRNEADAIEKEEETSIKHQVQETDDGSSNIRLTSKILTSTSLENEQKHLLEEGKEYENATYVEIHINQLSNGTVKY